MLPWSLFLTAITVTLFVTLYPTIVYTFSNVFIFYVRETLTPFFIYLSSFPLPIPCSPFCILSFLLHHYTLQHFSSFSIFSLHQLSLDILVIPSWRFFYFFYNIFYILSISVILIHISSLLISHSSPQSFFNPPRDWYCLLFKNIVFSWVLFLSQVLIETAFLLLNTIVFHFVRFPHTFLFFFNMSFPLIFCNVANGVYFHIYSDSLLEFLLFLPRFFCLVSHFKILASSFMARHIFSIPPSILMFWLIFFLFLLSFLS